MNISQPRVISLLPSATEIIALVGGSKYMVGRSHECDYPKSLSHLPVLTSQRTVFTTPADVDRQVRESLQSGTSLYFIDETLLADLKPSVIVTQSLCSVCSIDVEAVYKIAETLNPKPEIVCLNPHTLEEMLDSITLVGNALGLHNEAQLARNKMEQRIDVATASIQNNPNVVSKKVAFIEWTEPLYVGGHWTPQLIQMAGCKHPLNEDIGSKSFAVENKKVIEMEPDEIIVAPCGLDLEKTQELVEEIYAGKDPWFRELDAVKEGRIVLVDGNQMFNRPGPRLVDCLEWLTWYLHAESRSTVPDDVADFPFKRFVAPERIEEQVIKSCKAVKTENLCPEIEEAHRLALDAGSKHYIDPKTGYHVFTEIAALERGYCCGRGCRHCPYGHVNVPLESSRKNKVEEPVLMKFKRKKAAPKQYTKLLFWSGGKDSYLTYLALKNADDCEVVLCTTFQRSDNMISEQNFNVSVVVKQAKQLKCDLLMIPLDNQCPNTVYVTQVDAGIKKFCDERKIDPQQLTLVFGDLHLKDIKEWREANFEFLNIPCEFPLFNVPYDELIERLWQKEEPEAEEIDEVVFPKIVISNVRDGIDQVSIGESFTKELYERLKTTDIDPFGECGEFHSQVILN